MNYPSLKGEWASSFNERDLAFFLAEQLEYLPEVLFSACIVFLRSIGIKNFVPQQIIDVNKITLLTHGLKTMGLRLAYGKLNMNANNDNREKREDRPLHRTGFTEEALESEKASVLKELKNHADAIEKTVHENKGYFTGEMSGIEFNPDDNYHREYLPYDGFVLWVPDDPVHKLFWVSDMESLVSVSLCPDGIVAMETATNSESMFPLSMLALMKYLNNNAPKFFAKKEKEASE